MGQDVASRQTAVITNNGIYSMRWDWVRCAGAVDLAADTVSALLGFNPWWDTEFEFEVAVPDLALVRFMVEDYDSSSKNDFIGQSTIPWNSLKQGECWRERAFKEQWAEPARGSGQGLASLNPLLTHPLPSDQNCPFPPGYRHVHLLSKNGDLHPSATLFVKISIQD